MMSQLSLAALMNAFPLGQVHQALRASGTESVRRRLLPAESVVYLLLMMALYAEVSVRENLRLLWEPMRRRLGLEATKVPVDSAVTKARKRLGKGALRWLFEHLARPRGRLDCEMLLLADRGFYSFECWKGCAGRCGALVWRVKKSLILSPTGACRTAATWLGFAPPRSWCAGACAERPSG